MSEERKVGMGMLLIDEAGKATYSGDTPPPELANMLKEKFGIELSGPIEKAKKIEPDVETFYVLTDTEFNTLVNNNFKNIQGIPFNFRDAYEGDFDSNTAFTNIDGKRPVGHALARLEELGRGEWELNGLNPHLFLNELVRYNELPAGDYIIRAE